MGVFLELMRLRPMYRFIAGTICLVAGILSTAALWKRGVIWGAAILFLVIGLILTGSGLLGMEDEKKQRTFLESVHRRKGEILQVMISTQKQGRNPIRYLNEQGIHDPLLRTALLEEMNARLKGEA
jgi:hypothetical protein